MGLKTDQFFLFGVTPGRPDSRVIGRPLLLNGKRLGYARINLPAGDDEWLCPYFDPVTCSLRFRRRDGRDAASVFELNALAQCKDYRPLLVMAQAEGLLEKIPGMSQSFRRTFYASNDSAQPEKCRRYTSQKP